MNATLPHWLADFGDNVPVVPLTVTREWPSFVCWSAGDGTWLWCHAYPYGLEFIGMADSVQKAMKYSRARGWRYYCTTPVLFINEDGSFFELPLSWDDEDGS